MDVEDDFDDRLNEDAEITDPSRKPDDKDTVVPETVGGGLGDRELMAQRRDRVAKLETGTQADNQGMDWSDWSVGKASKVLRSENMIIVRRTLRRLHVRMWHAPAARLTDLPTTAGIPGRALDQIPRVVDTCPVCRMWSRPGNRPKASLSIVTDFNVEVQHDLVTWKGKQVLHLICVFLKFSQGGLLASRVTRHVLDMITHVWIRQFGPMKRLVSDHEGALDSDEARAWATRWGIEMHFCPKGAHAVVVEKHNDLLRRQLHNVDAQLSRDGIGVPDAAIVDEVFFIRYAMLSLNGHDTPYKGLYGRAPNLLCD